MFHAAKVSIFSDIQALSADIFIFRGILVHLLLAAHDLQAWMEQYETEMMFQEQVTATEMPS